MKLHGKKAIVTGANRSIGASIALKLAAQGADICISYRSDALGAERTKIKIEAMGRQSQALSADFSDAAGVCAFFEAAIAFLGEVNIVVNNAAGYDTTAFMDLSVDTFNHLLTVGVSAPMLLTQLAAKQMIAQSNKGAIINISSISGLKPYPKRVAHSNAKAALNMLTQNTALELAPYGIRVNGIAPGAVPYEESGTPTASIPLGRYGHPDDIANATAFLVSEEASWITGHTLVVDGGQLLSL